MLVLGANPEYPTGKQGEQLSKRVKQSKKQGSTPFLFEVGHHADYPCPGGAAKCTNPLPYYWRAFCSYQTGWEKTWTDFMICPKEKQASVANYYIGRDVTGFRELVEFSPCNLWPIIRGRTLWIVGDSHSYDFFHAAACFLLDLWDSNFRGIFPFAKEAEAFAAMEKHVQHTKPPECIPLLEDTMVCHFRVNHGQVFLGHALPLLERMAKPTDIAIVNFAHWHGTGDGSEYKKLLQEFAEAVEQSAERLPHMVWKEMVPTHYDQQHGLYPGGEPPFKCAPLHVELQSNGSIEATDDWSEIVVEGGHHNKAAREVFAGTDIVMTEYWNATVELFDYHRDVSDGRGHECGHYCFPGAPQAWLYYAYLAIAKAPWSPSPTA